MTGVSALTGRLLRSTLRDDLPFAVIAPVGFFVAFHLALRAVIDTGPMSYAQYLLPVVIIQVAFLGALTTVDRAAQDQRSGWGLRLRTLPIPALAPLASRMLYCLVRGVVAMLAAIGAAYLFGFRMAGGLRDTAAFVLLVLLFTLAISLGADAIGTRLAATPIAEEGTASQLLLIPQIVLAMVSTGFAPLAAFPQWLHPFVRYQPVSPLTETLRGLTTGRPDSSDLALTLAWCLGLLVVFGAVAVRMQRRAG